MADTIQISRLSSTLDECLSKIERLGVSLKDLKSNEAVLAEFESVLDDIQKKKDTLLGSSAADSVKQQVGDLMGKLQDAMGSGANLSSLFGSINRIRDLARGGGESLPSFSPSARARYQDVSDSYAAAGFGRGGVPQAGLVRNVRSVVADVPSGTSASYGGMNAFMSTRALAMGDALSGYGVRESSRSLSQQLADETQSDVMEDSVATIQRTSDEILDALQRPREAKGSVKARTTVKREVQKRDGGFSWGGLFKTVGTVGLIGGALFGALGSETVSQWLVDMTDPEKREEWLNKQKKWFEDKWAEFKPVWETTQRIASQVWDAVSELVSVVGGVDSADLTPVTNAGFAAYETLSEDDKPVVKTRVDVMQRRGGVEVPGLSTTPYAELGGAASRAAASLAGAAAFPGLSVAAVKALYAGGPVVVGVAGWTIWRLAAELKGNAEREKFNVLSAQAALDAKQAGFWGFSKRTGNELGWIWFADVLNDEKAKWSSSMSNNELTGLAAVELASESAVLEDYNTRAYAQQLIGGQLRKFEKTYGKNPSEEHLEVRHRRLVDLTEKAKTVLSEGSIEDVKGLILELRAAGLELSPSEVESFFAEGDPVGTIVKTPDTFDQDIDKGKPLPLVFALGTDRGILGFIGDSELIPNEDAIVMGASKRQSKVAYGSAYGKLQGRFSNAPPVRMQSSIGAFTAMNAPEAYESSLASKDMGLPANPLFHLSSFTRGSSVSSGASGEAATKIGIEEEQQKALGSIVYQSVADALRESDLGNVVYSNNTSSTLNIKGSGNDQQQGFQ